MKIEQFQERENLDHCSAPRCRHQSSVIYPRGATPANPRRTLSLCDEHYAEFCQLPSSRRDRGAHRHSSDEGVQA